ncbi:MAG TPA: HIG1 domain-containing protein [Casimicrobiaceae bacterium]
MSFVALLVSVAVVATIGALAFGVSSMVRDGEVGHLDGEHWMAIRVFLQAATVLVVAVALYAAL